MNIEMIKQYLCYKILCINNIAKKSNTEIKEEYCVIVNIDWNNNLYRYFVNLINLSNNKKTHRLFKLKQMREMIKSFKNNEGWYNSPKAEIYRIL